MARGRAPAKASTTGRSSSSRKAANQLGYAKRQTLKSRTLGSQLSDVYEYQQEKVRRAKVKPLLEKDEIVGLGGTVSASEDEEGFLGKRKGIKPRLVGEKDDDSGIGEDEDEEIDSDEAFEESDEERFAGFSFSRNVSTCMFFRMYLTDLIGRYRGELSENQKQNALPVVKTGLCGLQTWTSTKMLTTESARMF